MKTVLTRILVDTIRDALLSIPEDDRRSIYAVSLLVECEDDDPRLPTLTVGFNTVEQWKDTASGAVDADEAKWNYAYWLQNEVARIGGRTGDEADRIQAFIEDKGLSFTDEDEDEDFERCSRLGERIVHTFVASALKAVRKLHEDGQVEEVFGRSIPLLVHGLDYDEETAENAGSSNPDAVCGAFVDWVRRR